MQENRGDLLTRETADLADFLTKYTTLIPDNTTRLISPADVRTTFGDDLRTLLDDMLTNIIDSKFNLLSDTSDEIIEGTTNLFATPPNLLAWISNPVNVTTDDLNEGTANLYYTDARVDARINLLRPSQPVFGAVAGSQPVTITALGQSFNLVDTEARTAINQIRAILLASNIAI